CALPISSRDSVREGRRPLSERPARHITGPRDHYRCLRATGAPMSAPVPVVALIAYPRFSPFHFAMPYMVFGTHAPGQPLFELRIVAPDEQALRAERALALEPDGGLELADTADILVVPGWHAQIGRAHV